MHGILAKKVVPLSLQQPGSTGYVHVCDVCFWFIIGLGTLGWWQLRSQIWGHGQRRSCSLRKWGYWEQVFRPETCRNVMFTYSFTIHYPFASKTEWLQRISLLVLPSFVCLLWHCHQILLCFFCIYALYSAFSVPLLQYNCVISQPSAEAKGAFTICQFWNCMMFRFISQESSSSLSSLDL